MTGNDRFDPAPVTGFFYLLNAGVLQYDATITPPGGPAVADSGPSETYLAETFATTPGVPDLNVASASAFFKQGLGSNTGAVAAEEGVPASPLPGVEVTMPTSVNVSADLSTTGPTLPANFAIGEPPAYYELSTGRPSAGRRPSACPSGLGRRVDAAAAPLRGRRLGAGAVAVFGPPENRVCGDVTSFSPFAAAFKEPTYAFTGFSQPVDNAPTFNKMKAGAAVPVKFSLGGDFGLAIFEAGYPSSTSVACPGTSAAVDAVEQTVATDSSKLDLRRHVGPVLVRLEDEQAVGGVVPAAHADLQ